jgi:hypothetical protein
MYDPTVGRFLQEDPSGIAGGDANFYRYCGNEPLTHVDPLGLCKEEATDYVSCVNTINIETAIDTAPFSDLINRNAAVDFVADTTRVSITDLDRGIEGLLEPPKPIYPPRGCYPPDKEKDVSPARPIGPPGTQLPRLPGTYYLYKWWWWTPSKIPIQKFNPNTGKFEWDSADLWPSFEKPDAEALITEDKDGFHLEITRPGKPPERYKWNPKGFGGWEKEEDPNEHPFKSPFDNPFTTFP